MPHLLKRSVALLLVLVCATGLALAAPRNPSLLRPTAQLSAQALKLNLANALQTYKLAPAARERLTATYGQLPLDVQQTAAAMLDPKLADALGLPGVAFPRAKAQAVLERVDISLVRALLKVRLTEVAPASGGTPGDVAAAVGDNFTNDCIVQINGAAAPNTYYWANTLILFRIPDTATLGSTVNITVHKPSASETSAVRTLKIVAERGYRGVHGLSFPNFGDPNISWSVYRSCFGQSNVEFADGTHRPSAQTWYDSTYKTIGQNGNCYGMSQLSLRLREFTHYGNTSALSNVMHADWVGSNVTWGAWTLAWNTTSMEAVESLQGQQAVEPMATHIATQRANQDNKTAWDYARNMLNTQGQSVQNTLYGHAVVTFATEVDGTSHKFCFYDNNNPYTETDTDAPDPDHGVTNWNTGSFSYYTYWRTRCYDPHLLTGQPLLPAGVGPADSAAEGSGATRAVRFEVPRVAGLIITDEAGRGGAEGAGVPGLLEVEPEMGLGPVPATFPRIFLLQQAAGRSLNFTIPNAGGQTRQLTCFSRGGMLQLSLSGASLRVGFSQLAQLNAQATLPDPGGSGLQQIRIIASIGQAEERQLQGDSFTGLGATPLAASLSADRSAIELLSAPGAQPIRLRLQLRRFHPGGADTRPDIQQLLTAGQLHRIGPLNWAALGGQLRLEQMVAPPSRLQRP